MWIKEVHVTVFPGTILSQSSVTSSPPVKTVVIGSSDGTGSPSIGRRKSSKRITAKEGSKILEKFTRKSTIEDESPGIRL